MVVGDCVDDGDGRHSDGSDSGGDTGSVGAGVGFGKECGWVVVRWYICIID